MRVEIMQKHVVFKQAIFCVEEARLRYERFDGSMSAEVTRLSFERGDSVAAVLYNPTTDTVILAEQFRFPAYEKGPGWVIELAAGVLDPGQDPRAAMERELKEELGYSVQSLEFINTFYPSPGGSSERIHLFYASVADTDKTASGGGLAKESEDIRTVVLKTDEAWRRVAAGEIVDAKTIIGLQWLQLRRRA